MSIVKIHEQQKERAIKVAAGIATVVFCYAVMIHPVFRDTAVFRQNIRDSQKRTELYQEVQDLKERLDDSESILATLTERSQLLGKISDLASRNQIRVQTLTPRTEPEGGYVKLRIEMDGQGSFFFLLKFLQDVEKISASIKVTHVTVLWKPSPAATKENKYPLQIQLSFETFLKQRVKKINA